MIKVKVKMRNIEDVMDFTKDMSKMASDVDIVKDKYCCDAKSLLSLYSVNLREPFQIVLNSDDLSEIAFFKSICERYEVKDNENFS